VAPEYSERELTIPSYGDNGQLDHEIRARYLRSDLPGPRPLVIVLPIYARFTYPSRRVGNFIQRKSDGAVHVLDVEGKSFLIDWVALAETDDEDRFMELLREGIDRERITVIDIRRLIDWAEQRPEIDADRVALVGFSRSAIVAGIVATQEPRLAATVLMMGGAHPHRIIARCDGARTTAVHANVMDRFGWDQDELERRIEGIFEPVDAANYAGRVDPESVLIFEAARDECVPESSRDALKTAMGNPKTYSLDTKHRTAFLAITPLGGNWLCRRTWDFLEERFELDDR
jgi:dienelactone hydrolase